MAIEQDPLFYARLDDLFELVDRKFIPKYTSFFDEGQLYFAKQYLKNHTGNFLFWGGYEGAKRQMLGVFPDYLEPEGSLFPLSALTVTYRKEDTLSHRDFLGSLMALGIKRGAVGDILVMDGCCVFFATEKVGILVQSELKKVGRIGVKITSGIQVPLNTEEKFQEIGGTVASMRLDCVVSLLIGKSREKASELIKSGLVMLNYQLTDKNSTIVAPGDVLSIRGFGKAKLADEIRETKKGRISLKLLKYI